MLFTETKSGLVRLSDTIKLSLDVCADATRELLREYRTYREPYRDMQILAAKIHAARSDVAYEAELRQLADRIPAAVMMSLANRAATIHTQALSAILLTCFAAEAYANSFAYFLTERGVAISRDADQKSF